LLGHAVEDRVDTGPDADHLLEQAARGSCVASFGGGDQRREERERGASLRFLLTRLYDWTSTPAGALVTRKDPLEYVRKLRFFSSCEGPGSLGL
jgi:Ser/Thr protein kinase RdoA (MazF antagonist)